MRLALIFIVTIVVVNMTLSSGQLLGMGKNRLERRHRDVVGTLTAKEDTCADVEEYYFKDAVIDNFAPVNAQEKWHNKGQRYWINRKFWAGAGAPVFVFIGGEGEESCSRLTDSLYMYNLAEQNNALMIDVEHRYYGQSLPTEDCSTKNLAWLSSDQALADLARIIPHIKQMLNSPHSKVITFGGSYPGNLSGWFRLKYPSITQGSIASSAPVRAEENFSQYMDVVAEAMIHYGGQPCYNAFEEAANEIAKLAAEGIGSDGMAKIEKDFNTCTKIKDELDLATFMANTMGLTQGITQYNNEVPGSPTVSDMCQDMAGEGSSYDKFVALNAKMAESYGEKCNDISYKASVAYLKTSGLPTNAARSWIYQTCAEFGYYQTTDSPNQPFHAFKQIAGLDYSRKMCYDVYDGWSADPAIQFTNEKYGATGIDVTNVVFTSGTIDPWHALGVTNYTQPLPQYPSSLPVYILGTAHCNDLKAPKDTDPESLVAAREIVAEYVNKWVSQ